MWVVNAICLKPNSITLAGSELVRTRSRNGIWFLLTQTRDVVLVPHSATIYTLTIIHGVAMHVILGIGASIFENSANFRSRVRKASGKDEQTTAYNPQWAHSGRDT